ncbi:MAG: hypothetical protein HY982_02565 [Candidatus Magasanikbacteria bacterium]|nr:hypothetical protein [Candidatus Magasanikbacteria bacterium]
MKKLKVILFTAIFSFLFSSPSPVLAQIPAVDGPVDPLFNPNYILSDSEMIDYNSLTSEEIKNFLKSKPGILGQYEVLDQNGLNRSAAELIFEACQRYQINPKVVLVLLQKEQSLVENPNPIQYHFDWAAGYARCDSCLPDDPLALRYKGFAKQVDGAAGALRYYLDAADQTWLKRAGLIYNIDSIPVIPANKATALLYTYTPHFRGNYNFWRVWQRWFSQKFPDGLIVRAKDNDGLYLVQKGKIFPFKNRAVFLSRFNPKNVTLVEKTDLDSYSRGPEIKYLNYSLVKTEDKKIYLLVDNKKRLLDKAAFRYYGFDPEEVLNGKSGDLVIYDEADPVSVKAKYPLGALMQDGKTKAYFLVEDSIKHPLYDKALITLNFSSKKLRKVDSRALAKFKDGAPILFPDGTWVREKNGAEVYIISNGERRWVRDETTFNALGGNWDNVMVTNEKMLSLHPAGEPIFLTPSGSPAALTQANQ